MSRRPNFVRPAICWQHARPQCIKRAKHA